MIANRRRDTRPEIAVRRLLYARGLRFRVDYPVRTSERPIRVDIAFPRDQVAILLDGCFWHGCPQHGTMPKHNHDYWAGKIARNQERDLHQVQLLTEAGWRALRFWTHEQPSEICDRIQTVLAEVRQALESHRPAQASDAPTGR